MPVSMQPPTFRKLPRYFLVGVGNYAASGADETTSPAETTVPKVGAKGIGANQTRKFLHLETKNSFQHGGKVLCSFLPPASWPLRVPRVLG